MRKWSIFTVAVFIFISAGFFISSLLNTKSLSLVRAQLLGGNNFVPSLDKTVSQALEGTKGTYAVVIENLKTGEKYSLNADTNFESGSLYKLWVMATVYGSIENGEIKEDDILSQDIPTLNQEFNIDEEDAELTWGYISMSVSDALDKMITISHNYAALLLEERMTNSKIQDFIDQNDFKNSHLGEPPTTTANDIAMFFKRLYRGEIINEKYSKEMMDLLKKQQLNGGLPKQLPDGTIVAHKTGDIELFKHDGGIVFTNKGDYIIVVLSESDSPLGAQERIAQVSKAVYDYFTK